MNHHEDWMNRHQEGGGETERTSKTKGYREAMKKHAARKAAPSQEKALNQMNGHNKGGQIGALKGLMNTKHFGAKKGARRESAIKKRSNGGMPF